MSTSILDRLSARIAAAPALPGISTLFSDLKEAHSEILTLADKVKALQAAPKSGQPAAQSGAGTVIPTKSPSIIAHVHQLLMDAKERLSVNATGTVASHIDTAIKLLEDK